MNKVRILLSVYLAISLVSLAALSLRLSLYPLVVFYPGGLALLLFDVLPHPALLMLTNAGFYSPIIWAVLRFRFPDTPETRLRLLTKWIGVTAALLLACAFIPAINPLWPRGMEELTKQEADLRSSLPEGISIDSAQSVLKSRNIKFDIQDEHQHRLVLQNRDVTVWADPGDWVMASRFQTDASEYPCGFDMQIVLVFGKEGLAKQTYVSRFPMCP